MTIKQKTALAPTMANVFRRKFNVAACQILNHFLNNSSCVVELLVGGSAVFELQVGGSAVWSGQVPSSRGMDGSRFPIQPAQIAQNTDVDVESDLPCDYT